MNRTFFSKLLICVGLTVLCQQQLNADSQSALIDHLMNSKALNIETIIDEQFKLADKARGSRVSDPYGSNAGEIVQSWSKGDNHAQEVCALRFLSASHTGYELRGFERCGIQV